MHFSCGCCELRDFSLHFNLQTVFVGDVLVQLLLLVVVKLVYSQGVRLMFPYAPVTISCWLSSHIIPCGVSEHFIRRVKTARVALGADQQQQRASVISFGLKWVGRAGASKASRFILITVS